MVVSMLAQLSPFSAGTVSKECISHGYGKHTAGGVLVSPRSSRSWNSRSLQTGLSAGGAVRGLPPLAARGRAAGQPAGGSDAEEGEDEDGEEGKSARRGGTRGTKVVRADLEREVAEKANVTRATANLAVAAALDFIVERVSKGDKVTFLGFGYFEGREYKKRTGAANFIARVRDKGLGDATPPAPVPPTAAEEGFVFRPVFKPGKAFKEAVAAAGGARAAQGSTEKPKEGGAREFSSEPAPGSRRRARSSG